jgi:hypothetical protein
VTSGRVALDPICVGWIGCSQFSDEEQQVNPRPDLSAFSTNYHQLSRQYPIPQPSVNEHPGHFFCVEIMREPQLDLAGVVQKRDLVFSEG